MKERFRLYHIGDARPRCIAYTEGSNGGSICGKPTVIVDEERGGMVCAEHAPKKKDFLRAGGGEQATLRRRRVGIDQLERK